MAKLFLSVLGTGSYVPCTYYLGDKEVCHVRFAQEATIGICCRGWGKGDRAVVFTTDEAYRINWLDGESEGLKTRLETMARDLSVESRRIPAGRSMEEIWEIFEVIFQEIGQGDHVVFDITHAFRSLPMLAFVILGYAKVLKAIHIQGIYYGALEALGPLQEVRNLPPEQRRVPLFDLTPFDALMEWTVAVDRFLGAGDALPLCRLADDVCSPVLHETRGRHPTASTFKKTARRLMNFTENLATCRAPNIGKNAQHLKNLLDKAIYEEPVTGLRPLVPLLEKVKRDIEPFCGELVADGIQAARWCLRHNLVQQAYTILEETVLTYVLMALGRDKDIMDISTRLAASSAFGIARDKKPEEQWQGEARKKPEFVKQVLDFISDRKEFAVQFGELHSLRNTINHAGYSQNTKAETFRENLEPLIQGLEQELSSSSKRGG